MHIAIAVGTMLLSGVVLNTSEQDEETAWQQQPSTESSEQAAPSKQPRRPAMGYQDPSMGYPQGEGMRGRAGSGGQQARMQRQNFMPAAPTDGGGFGGEGGFGQPMAPTSNAPLMERGGAPGQRSRSRAVTAPTDRRSYSSQSGSGFHATPSSTAGDQTKRAELQRNNVGIMSPSLSEKAFSGYKATSGVSPYMNLFRRDSLGTIDNYTSLVRPELEQRNVNQQYGRDIRGLERDTRRQGSSLQQLNKDTRTLQGVSTPQFQNYGNYYQGYGQ